MGVLQPWGCIGDKEMLIPRGWDDDVLWSIVIYLKNHSLVKVMQ